MKWVYKQSCDHHDIADKEEEHDLGLSQMTKCRCLRRYGTSGSNISLLIPGLISMLPGWSVEFPTPPSPPFLCRFLGFLASLLHL